MMKEPIVVKDDVIVYRINGIILSSFTGGQNMMAVLETNKNRFSTLIQAIQATGLTNTLTKGDNNSIRTLIYIKLLFNYM